MERLSKSDSLIYFLFSVLLNVDKGEHFVIAARQEIQILIIYMSRIKRIYIDYI